MKLPTHEKCFALLKKYEMPKNILDHSILVNKVAVYLAKKLKLAGIDVDVDVVDRASLLHDIGKLRTLKKMTGVLDWAKDEHHIEGEKILTDEGYPELGLVARRHSLRELKNVNKWEEKIVKYADLRAKHDKLVDVRERMEDLGERYKVPEEERVPLSEVLKLEKEIFDVIGESPDIVKKAIK
jgi:putative nucleotidyltransferase with HDIG domain